MKKYSYETIDELVQPVMEMMREEFPNDCVMTACWSLTPKAHSWNTDTGA